MAGNRLLRFAGRRGPIVRTKKGENHAEVAYVALSGASMQFGAAEPGARRQMPLRAAKAHGNSRERRPGAGKLVPKKGAMRPRATTQLCAMEGR